MATNVRKDANIMSPNNVFLELDIWFPELKLAFEFQDPHHYTTDWRSHFSLKNIREKDKKSRMHDRGETLITVPYWWDGEKESLIATIHSYRRDLILETPVTAKPIAHEPPVDLYEHVPGIGELQMPSFIVSSQFDPTSWWMSEKYDGARACWNPHTKVLYPFDLRTKDKTLILSIYSRNGVGLCVPSQLLWHFPNIFLEGEIWFGRGSFVESQRVHDKECEAVVYWADVRYVTFDCPEPSANARKQVTGHDFSLDVIEQMLYEQRYKHILANISMEHPLGIPTSPMSCRNKLHLVNATQALLEQAGEGTVIQRPRAVYEHGRTEVALKFKAARADMEALVISAENDAYSLKMPDGTIFNSTVQNSETKVLRPRVGDIVTFSYESIHPQGRPRSSNITKLRKDLTWDHVLHNYHHQILSPQTETISTKKAFNNSQFRQPSGHWTKDGGKNIKIFFDTFASNHNFLPDDPEAWYKCTTDMIHRVQGGVTILQHYGGSLIRALVDVYPQLKLDASKFTFKSQNFWSQTKNRLKFLENFAAKSGFDPKQPENWYSVSPFDIKSEKGGASFLNLYNSSLIAALVDMYPNIGLDKTKFADEARKYTSLRIPREGRKFFDRLARKFGFDSLLPENWYTFPRSSALLEKGTRVVLSHFQHSYVAALIAVYPDVDLQRDKFRIFRTSTKYTKRFFDNFAKTKAFDPLLAKNWYYIKKQDVIAMHGGGILKHYGESLYKALVHAYPEIGLEQSLLRKRKKR